MSVEKTICSNKLSGATKDSYELLKYKNFFRCLSVIKIVTMKYLTLYYVKLIRVEQNNNVQKEK